LIESALLLTHSIHHVSMRSFFGRVLLHLLLETLPQHLFLLQPLVLFRFFTHLPFIIDFLF
jgi:hypothetical protein